MKIKIINVGNKLNKWESDGIGYYQKQLPKNIKISFINLKGQQNPNLSKKEILQKEGKQVLSKISRSDYVISWDSTGKQLDSYEFSNFILDSTQSKKEIFFSTYIYEFQLYEFLTLSYDPKPLFVTLKY